MFGRRGVAEMGAWFIGMNRACTADGLPLRHSPFLLLFRDSTRSKRSAASPYRLRIITRLVNPLLDSPPY